MIIKEPKKKTYVDAPCFSVRAPAETIREFMAWQHAKLDSTTRDRDENGLVDGTWVSPIHTGGSGPYWDIRCFTEQAASEVREWLQEHGFEEEDYDL